MFPPQVHHGIYVKPQDEVCSFTNDPYFFIIFFLSFSCMSLFPFLYLCSYAPSKNYYHP